MELLRVEAAGRDIGEAYLARLEADRRDGSLRTSAWAATQQAADLTAEPSEEAALDAPPATPGEPAEVRVEAPGEAGDD